MIISVRISDMIESYKKYLETKLGTEFQKQEGFTISVDGKEYEPEVFNMGYMRFGNINEKFPILNKKQ